MSTDAFNVLLLGAGPVNFGTTEGPWNHSKRLEQKLGSRLRVMGLVDKDKARAERVLTIKRNDDSVKAGYEHTQIFASVADAGKALKGELTPRLAVLGFGALPRGSTQPGHDAEIQVIEQFPNVALFIEKPISAHPIEEVEKVAKRLEGRVTSVGYMLRYLKACQEMKRLIEENKLKVTATLATYFVAYEYGANKDQIHHTAHYWNKDQDMGPVVTQGTHICDLGRYFCPTPDLASLRVHTIEHSDPTGKLSLLDEWEQKNVRPDNRIPRNTNAIWRYENGAMGQFMHGITLHEGDYDCELVVLADGWKMRLVDPYGTSPRLHVRRPCSKEEVITEFKDDDCYYSEFSALIDVIEGKGDKSAILSSYEDAMETYRFTWAITWAGEKSFQERSSTQ